jgi:hypothetical protein
MMHLIDNADGSILWQRYFFDVGKPRCTFCGEKRTRQLRTNIVAGKKVWVCRAEACQRICAALKKLLPHAEEWLPLPEAADAIGMSESDLAERIRTADLHWRRCDGQPQVRRVELLQWILAWQGDSARPDSESAS